MKMRLQQAFFNSSQGLNTENFERNSTGNASWGVGPNTENFEKKFYNASWGVGSTKRNGFPISTDNAEVGGAPT